MAGLGLGLRLSRSRVLGAAPDPGSVPVITALTISDPTPVVGVAITSSFTASGSPTLAYQWRRDGANISGATSSGYTPVSGDIGTTLSLRAVPTNGAGPGDAVVATAVAASKAAPASDQIYIEDYAPVAARPNFYQDGKYIRWLGQDWAYDSVFAPHSVTSPDGKLARFETRQNETTTIGYPDTAGIHRNKFRQRVESGPTLDHRFSGRFRIRAGAAVTATYNSLFELHSYAADPNLIYAKKAEFALTTAERLTLMAPYSPSSGTRAYRDLWLAPSAIARDAWHDFDLGVVSDPTGAAGRIIMNLNGATIANLLGQVGWHLETKCGWEVGMYRGGNNPAETIIIEWDDCSIISGPFGTVTMPSVIEPPMGPNLVPGSFTNADAGTFATDTDTAFWRATSGGSTGPSNIPGGYFNLSGLTPGDVYRSQGTTRRGTMTNAKNVVFNNDGSFDELGSYITTNTTNTDYAFDVTIPASGTVRLYYGGQASASSQTAFHHKANMKFRKVL